MTDEVKNEGESLIKSLDVSDLSVGVGRSRADFSAAALIFCLSSEPGRKPTHLLVKLLLSTMKSDEPGCCGLWSEVGV